MLLQLYSLQQKQKTEQKKQSNRLTQGERRNWSVTKCIVSIFGFCQKSNSNCSNTGTTTSSLPHFTKCYLL